MDECIKEFEFFEGKVKIEKVKKFIKIVERFGGLMINFVLVWILKYKGVFICIVSNLWYGLRL